MAEFEWDEANRGHLLRHGVSTEEAEEVSMNFPLDLDMYSVDEELRFEELGQTSAGRILKLVSTLRGDRIRIVTAYDATPGLRRLYLAQR